MAKLRHIKLHHPATCYCRRTPELLTLNTRDGDRDATIVPKHSSRSDQKRLIDMLNLVINNCGHNNVITEAVTHNGQQGASVKR